jgi:hypothetical protein
VQRFDDGVVFHEFKSNACCWLAFLVCLVNFLEYVKNRSALAYFRNA